MYKKKYDILGIVKLPPMHYNATGNILVSKIKLFVLFKRVIVMMQVTCVIYWTDVYIQRRDEWIEIWDNENINTL